RWIRLVFDAKLKESCPFDADQAIMMMILKCDKISTFKTLANDAGISHKLNADTIIQSLIDQRFISNNNGNFCLLEKGE
ncbi:hypothetical protein ACO1ND_14305, partial [Staphylococcus aureus]